eukprot:c43420_g1_i1 orf=162-356(-)
MDQLLNPTKIEVSWERLMGEGMYRKNLHECNVYHCKLQASAISGFKFSRQLHCKKIQLVTAFSA